MAIPNIFTFIPFQNQNIKKLPKCPLILRQAAAGKRPSLKTQSWIKTPSKKTSIQKKSRTKKLPHKKLPYKKLPHKKYFCTKNLPCKKNSHMYKINQHSCLALSHMKMTNTRAWDLCWPNPPIKQFPNNQFDMQERLF